MGTRSALPAEDVATLRARRDENTRKITDLRASLGTAQTKFLRIDQELKDHSAAFKVEKARLMDEIADLKSQVVALGQQLGQDF